MSAATNDWHQTAACSSAPKIMHSDYTAAKNVCAGCPHTGLQGPCFEQWASMPFSDREQNVSVWAGMAPDELMSIGGRRDTPQVRVGVLELLRRGDKSCPTMARALNRSNNRMQQTLNAMIADGQIERYRPSERTNRTGVIPYMYRRARG